MRGNGYGRERGCSNKTQTQQKLSRKKVGGTRGIKAIEDGVVDGRTGFSVPIEDRLEPIGEDTTERRERERVCVCVCVCEREEREREETRRRRTE